MAWSNNKIHIEPDRGIVSKYYIVIDQNFVHSYRNSVDLRLLRKGFFHDFKTVSLFFWLLLLQILIRYFETIPSVHIYSDKPASRRKKFV